MTGPPQIDAAVLAAHHAVYTELSQWMPTVHRLVCERVAALVEANGDYEHPLETAVEYAQRVLANGQQPFPPGVSIYDELASNRGYDWVTVGYGTAEDGGERVTFSGLYFEITDGRRVVPHPAEVHCPSWVISDPDGIARFEAQTEQMCAQVRADREEFHARISRAADAFFANRKTEGEQPCGE